MVIKFRINFFFIFDIFDSTRIILTIFDEFNTHSFLPFDNKKYVKKEKFKLKIKILTVAIT